MAFTAVIISAVFQLTRLMRGVTGTRIQQRWYKTFQLTRLMRGVTLSMNSDMISGVFQLTRLMRGVTIPDIHRQCSRIHFNSHASCEA